jgi:hypothetical protein
MRPSLSLLSSALILVVLVAIALGTAAVAERIAYELGCQTGADWRCLGIVHR